MRHERSRAWEACIPALARSSQPRTWAWARASCPSEYCNRSMDDEPRRSAARTAALVAAVAMPAAASVRAPASRIERFLYVLLYDRSLSCAA